MHMELKHKESGRIGVVHGWGDKNDEPWLELWFPDKDPADKNSEDRSTKKRSNKKRSKIAKKVKNFKNRKGRNS